MSVILLLATLLFSRDVLSTRNSYISSQPPESTESRQLKVARINSLITARCVDSTTRVVNNISGSFDQLMKTISGIEKALGLRQLEPLLYMRNDGDLICRRLYKAGVDVTTQPTINAVDGLIARVNALEYDVSSVRVRLNVISNTLRYARVGENRPTGPAENLF